jgi:phosphatidylinositol 4-kinase B
VLANLKNLDLEARVSIGQGGGGGSSWLLRLFESNCFDVGIAMQYLHTAKEVGVASYLGNRLFRFPNEEVGLTICPARPESNLLSAVQVDFYIPQLITMYVNNYNRVADALHPYLLARCRDSHFFSLRCYWLLEAYDGVSERTPHAHALMQAILRDFLPFRQSGFSSHRGGREELKPLQAAVALPGSLSLNGHHRSQSDARIDASFLAGEESTGGMHRTAGSSSSLATAGSSQSGRGNHNSMGSRGVGCNAQLSGGDTTVRGFRALNALKLPELTIQTAPLPLSQLEFINSLLQIGLRLRDLSTSKEERSKRLIYELFILNFHLPARVWVPLYTDEQAHLVVRIPFNEGCVLNSKEKAPYCIFVEALTIEEDGGGVEQALREAELPEKMDERFDYGQRKSERPVAEAGGEGTQGSREELTQFDSILMREEQQLDAGDPSPSTIPAVLPKEMSAKELMREMKERMRKRQVGCAHWGGGGDKRCNWWNCR